MIKIENGNVFMTAGDTCYVLKVDGGKLKRVYFGKRLEPEDDLGALGITGEDCGAVCSGLSVKDKNGKPAQFEYCGAEIFEQKPRADAPALNGGKTLKITLCDKNASVRAELYYTPYPRGGYARRIVIVNDGYAPASVGSDVVIGVFPRGYSPLGLCADGFAAVVKDGACERYGDVYGYLCAYGDGAVDARSHGDTTEVVLGFGGHTVAAHSALHLPETLAVYSDTGVGGMSRVFHDILRENMGTSDMTKRRPTVLFCPRSIEGSPSDAVKATSELGCDVFAVDIGAVTQKTFAEYVAACKDRGVKIGVGFKPDTAGRGTPLGGAVDLTDEVKTEEAVSRLSAVISDCDVEYLMIDTSACDIAPIARGLYRLRRSLAERFPELIIEWGTARGEVRYAMSRCYPPCMMRNVVRDGEDTSLKTEFDEATFGCLGYELDPTALGEDKKRAVRAQILSYQDDAPTVIRGDLYRSERDDGSEFLMSVTKDKSKAYAVCKTNGEKPGRAYLYGLDEHNIYRVRELNKAFGGAALARYGVAVPRSDSGARTYTLHIRQVADFE